MRRTSSGKRGRSARSACWTMPSSSHAPVASSSFSGGIPKSITARHAGGRERVDLAHETVEVEARHPRQRLVRERLGRDEERHDELVEVEPRLAHEPAQRGGATKPPQPGDGERAHARGYAAPPA